MMTSTAIPFNLRATLEKSNGKILAKPKITTLNGNKAVLQVKGTSYHPVQTFNQQGMPATDFRAIDDGITISLTPWITRHGDVNLEISPSIKTTQPTSDAARPSPVTDRTITTNVRLMDGETLILGGLIDSKESNIRRFVPILFSIPILGYLFSWNSRSQKTTEMVIFVTPKLVNDGSPRIELGKELKDLEERGGTVEWKKGARSLHLCHI